LAVRVAFSDNIANGENVQKEVTVVLKIKLVRVTSSDNIVNGEMVQREATVAVKVESV
jgi:hypothetical protein